MSNVGRLDKGTFDAMALYSAPSAYSEDTQGSRVSESEDNPTNIYPSRVVRLLKTGGFFLITCESIANNRASLLNNIRGRPIACNFTEKEVIAHFTEKESRLKYQLSAQSRPKTDT
jgi:hypothetical protein